MLEVTHLTKSFKREIFSNLNFVIPNGAKVHLKGVNGIGKTTLLKIMAGLLDYEGSISLDGVNQQQDFDTYFQSNAFVASTPLVIDYLTVNEMLNLVENATIPSSSTTLNKFKEWKDYYVLKLKLAPYLDELMLNLSLGTQQKVALVAALLSRPKLILLDEPFVNFDRESFYAGLEILEIYVRENDAILIYSSHSHDEEVLYFADYELIIENPTALHINQL
ncbi:MAG: ATP-binding cassette domain-containing protein [Micrococcaceae bacterium]